MEIETKIVLVETNFIILIDTLNLNVLNFLNDRDDNLDYPIDGGELGLN